MPDLTFDHEHHIYRLNGVVMPSVTQVISAAGLSNYDHVPADVLQAACEFGANVHKACEYSDKWSLDLASLDPALAPYLSAWVKFLSDYSAEVVEIEAPLYSPKYKFCGTPDRIAYIGGRLFVIDIKTATTILPCVAVQTAGYAQLYREHSNAKKISRMAVQLKADGYKVITYKDDLADWGTFLAALNITNWKRMKGIK